MVVLIIFQTVINVIMLSTGEQS